MEKPFEVIAELVPDQDKAYEFMEKLYTVANPKAVFGEPVEVGEYKVITATELHVMKGFGYGGGGGVGNNPGDEEKGDEPVSVGYGGGGGGGGTAAARPVAVIEIGPHGVRVEPIVDPTKIAIAFFTTLISIFAMGSKMKRARL
ncbi:MAG: hypothetical protein WA996_11880 [Candidatus Promineifilaceae bacterium]